MVKNTLAEVRSGPTARSSCGPNAAPPPVAGTAARHFAALITLGLVSLSLVLVAAPAAGVHVLKPYQVDRLTAFLNPSDNPRKQGYQQLQPTIAIGSGQKT